MGLHYKFISGKFTFNPGLSLHQYNTNNVQLNSKQEDNFSRFYQTCLRSIKLKSESLTYNYRKANVFNDISSFVQGYVFSNFTPLIEETDF
jgi:hypothetical protein